MKLEWELHIDTTMAQVVTDTYNAANDWCESVLTKLVTEHADDGVNAAMLANALLYQVRQVSACVATVVASTAELSTPLSIDIGGVASAAHDQGDMIRITIQTVAG